MILDINKLCESEFGILRDLGNLLYNRENQDGGLTKDEVCSLLDIMNKSKLEEFYKEYREGYDFEY